MFSEELRRSIERAPRDSLPTLSAALWKAFGAGAITEAEADALSRLIEARKTVIAAPAAPARRKLTGSRPRAPESLERRRRWCASSYLPPALAARFTPAEVAALSVIAVEAGHAGKCDLPIGRIAALAGVSESSVRNAVRAARGLGLVRVEERRVSAFRNDTNLVSVVSREWRAWLMRRAERGGCKSLKGTNKKGIDTAREAPVRPLQGAIGRRMAEPKSPNAGGLRFAVAPPSAGKTHARRS
ncbi:hypothetical protein [Methylobacterium nodulans]|uniref:Helix-turn-helix domain-containing protein n=1 Tax=Methylobacterium nodulans (strain LMG 21967 / CNCM I-2342 / ORS 2060) TaxID=460265 RepID=B8IY40_METNO|nr:hypothetical protein [Methylobacterium nodulans]ACL63330.1 conserved hypothetical protein [Methylobacterium nodulans ORS 2060]